MFVLASLPSTAQEVPRVQVFGGYSYLRFDSRSFGFANSSNLNGYNLAPAFNLTRDFGVVAELSGQYGSHLNLRDIAVGPQFLYLRNSTLFSAHVLIGDARTFVSSGNTAGDTVRAVVVGGSVDHPVSPRFAWRIVQVDYLHTSLFHGTQNNLRISTGIVYRWGEIREKGHKRRSTPTP
jgi:hypothetical protein